MLVVNFFGAPGAGKSTAAAYVYALLKMEGINTELVTEVAKECVWEESKTPFSNQEYLFGRQSHAISRVEGKVDVVVTDSPILLSAVYDPYQNTNLKQYILDVYSRYSNMNFFVHRQWSYEQNGRIHSDASSQKIERDLRSMLNDLGIEYTNIQSDRPHLDVVASDIIRRIRSKTPVARINYLGSDGRTGDTQLFFDESHFLRVLKEQNYYGVPMTVDLFRDDDGNRISADFIEEMDPPILGIHIRDWEEE